MHDLLPLSTVESPHFKAFVNFLESKYCVPTRKLFSHKMLRDQYELLKNKVLKMLMDANNISITMDIWSNRQMKSYIGVTSHYISEW